MNTVALESLLKSQAGVWRGSDRYNDAHSVSTGFTTLDTALPSKGWANGCLTELLVGHHGIGEFSLLLPAIKQLTHQAQWVALIKPPFIPYAPALGNAGVKLEHMLVVNPPDDKSALWASEQCLRSGVFASVITWVQRSTPQKQRRLQIAAETGGSIAIMYRPESTRCEHSPAALRITLQQNVCAGQLMLDIIKVRNGKPQTVELGLDAFDQPQGVAWPGMPHSHTLAEADALSLHELALAAIMPAVMPAAIPE